jgi:hypothetical protein
MRDPRSGVVKKPRAIGMAGAVRDDAERWISSWSWNPWTWPRVVCRGARVFAGKPLRGAGVGPVDRMDGWDALGLCCDAIGEGRRAADYIACQLAT